MTEFKFKIPQRFDLGAAETGKEVRQTDNHGNYYGTFLVRLMNQDSRVYQVQSDIITRELRKEFGDKLTSDEMLEKQIDEGFFRIALAGWQDVVDEDDKPIPFSEEAARAYFQEPMTNFVKGKLIQFALKEENYDLPKKGRVAKN